MAKQQTLFSMPRSASKIKRMHVIDAGNGPNVSLTWLEWFCKRCGHNESGYYTGTVTEHKRGIPCPKCNPTTTIAER